MTAPVVIAGAGVGGLAAAVWLAAAGVPVTVLERADRVGGKAGVVTLDGVEVDTGPSVLTLPDRFEALFAAAGTSLADEVQVHAVAPACRYVYPSGLVLDVHHDPEATLASVRDALGARAADELAAFLAYARRIWDEAAPWFVLGEAPTPGVVLGLGPRAWAAVPRIDPLRSMRAGIDRHVSTPELRDLLMRFATYNGSDPRRAPATLNCIAHVELGLGVYGVQGGIAALVDALARVAVRHGAVLRCGTEVAGITCDARSRVTGVRLGDGSHLPAATVVVNADVGLLTSSWLPPHVRHGLSPRTTPSTSGWTGIVRARRVPSRVAHTVVFPERPYVEEFEDLFDRDRPPEAPTVYLCAQERAHGRSGWADDEPVFVMANAPAEPIDGPRTPPPWDAVQDAVMSRLRATGLIAADDALVWTRTATGLAEAFPGSRGALYGAASNDLLAAFRRPPNRVTAVPGLYLASGSAHPGGGLPLCLQSGMAAARAVCDDLGVPGPVRA
ncbi:MAG: phytoene desaturase [Alphaproteobacteria bacterium]|nr:phytoene desaturase [Alphaproteobacteria bacterium]